MTTQAHKVARIAALPDDVIVDSILPKLPVKSLLRFKSVCRDWCSIIATPEFAKSQLATFAGSSCHRFLLLQQYAIVQNHNYRLFRAGFEHDGKYVKLKLAGSCHGLVAFYFETSDTVKFFVLNPATGQRIEILAPDDKDFKDSLYWFGYVSSIDDYKLTAFSPWNSAFWSFSCKAKPGIWKRISINEYITCGLSKSGRAALVNDSLYWPINKIGIQQANMGTDIFELNLVTEEGKVKPRLHFAYDHGIVNLVNFKGCLTLYTTSRIHCLDVWMLRQHDDWQSWEKVYSKVLKGVRLVYFSTTGKLFVSYLKQLKVMDNLYQLPPSKKDDKQRRDQEEILLYSLPSNGVEDYVESLISPFTV